MVDLAREQSPTLGDLYRFAATAQQSGYNALGLYLEHRFAYQCAPWAQGSGCVTRSMVENLQNEFPSLEIVPFINLLGHFEGFLYTEEGREFREEVFNGLQACPSCGPFLDLCKAMLAETMEVFGSQVIHIGGDETYQLNRCPKCQAASAGQSEDEKAWLYGRHFKPLIEQVLAAGRRPAVWGDMFLDHPAALEDTPNETLIFDWQYMNGLKETSSRFAGYEVVGCPTLHAYNAMWMHVAGSERNVREVARDVKEMGLAGFCLTTWEAGLFGSFESLTPAVAWSGRIADDPDEPGTMLSSFGEDEEWARLIGVELEDLGGVFAFQQHRNKLRSRLLLTGNPFLAWLHHREQLCGPDGEAALQIAEKALRSTNSEACKGVALMLRAAVEFVRIADQAATHYAKCEAERANGKLALLRTLFDDLEKVGRKSLEREGGSRADIERCRAAKKHVETVMLRVRDYGNRELGYLPAFEVLCNHRFVPHDQGCWWLVNKWSNE